MMTARAYDQSRWRAGRVNLSGEPVTPHEVSIAYIECPPPSTSKGTILLIHGFPLTSYAYRYVITPLSDKGYRVIAPDNRGAGNSSRPRDMDGYQKVQMATDLKNLLFDHLGQEGAVHVIGHDIGGMIAHAFAATFPTLTRTVAWGECPLPGTSAYATAKASPNCWHFAFHAQADLPELLVAGREEQYLRHFFSRQAYNHVAFADAGVAHYAGKYAQQGALRAAFDAYRALDADADANLARVREAGKCAVPCLSLAGEFSWWAEGGVAQAREMYESVSGRTVKGSGHYFAEENPEDFVAAVEEWLAASEHA